MYLSCVLGGLNQTKVYSIDTHEVHLSTHLDTLYFNSLCLCTNIYNYVV